MGARLGLIAMQKMNISATLKTCDMSDKSELGPDCTTTIDHRICPIQMRQQKDHQ
jgi:hypothetical protein